MKHVKKLLSAVLVLVLALTMVLPVAAEGTNTLTIKSKTSGHTYQAYQVFAGTLDNADKVLSDITWGSAIPEESQADTLAKIKKITAGNPATPLFADCKTAADVAAVLGEHKNDAELVDKFATVISGCVQGNPATNGDGEPAVNEAGEYVYQISNLDDGYYFVNEAAQKSETGNSYTKFMLQVVGNTEVNAKTDVPTAEKKVNENEKYPDANNPYGNGYNDVADYNIGDKVPFSFYSKVPDMSNFETYKYIFRDEMSTGLTFNNDVVVTIGTTTLTKDTDYTVTPTEKGFKVEIINLKDITAATKDAEIRVDFTARLNENAAVGLPGNPNTMTLEYSNNPNDTNETTTGNPDTVIVFTYEIDVNKVDGKDKTPLDGVQFKLYRKVTGEDGTTVNEYVTVEGGKVTGWATTKEGGTTLTTASGGTFAVSGLDAGTYYLEETQPKEGYNTLAESVELTIKATTKNGQDWAGGPTDGATALTALELKTKIDGKETTTTATKDQLTGGKVTTTVENYTGATLPSTGGIGTTIFYVVGGILVVGAAVLLIAKKRTKM